MTKEFEQSAYVGENSEPSAGDLGQSKINYGEQRMGTGVTKDEAQTYVEPGSEGAVALSLQKGNGGFSSHSSYDNPMKASPTGE